MKRTGITDQDIIEAYTQSGGNKAAAARILEMDKRGLERRLIKMPIPQMLPPAEIPKASRYVITAAVNATKAHARYLKTLEKYCDIHSAQLLIIPMRYKNPTRREESTDDEWWDARLVKYLVHDRVKIAPGMVLLADIKVQPTAINPLQGWLTVSGTDNAILGHTKIALKTVPTKPDAPAKIVQTTGAITVEQYSDSSAGKKGDFHHSLGAVIVDVDGQAVRTRHITPLKDGSFIDLAHKYTPEGAEDAPPASVLVMGDMHAELEDKAVSTATKALCELVKPRAIVAHDVLNFGSAGHHNDYFERFRRHTTKTSSVLTELGVTAKYLDMVATWTEQIVIVGSNHHDHFTKWLERHEHALDLENAIVFHETKAAMLRAIHERKRLDPFKHWMDQLMRRAAGVKWLRPGESYSRHGIEFGWHGHKGPNGARGSTKGFANIGAKVTKGHSHGAEIIDGAHSVGVSGRLNMGYNLDSPSGWTQTHEITYANGKRTLIHCIDGAFYS
jgi:hypothetical protein